MLNRRTATLTGGKNLKNRENFRSLLLVYSEMFEKKVDYLKDPIVVMYLVKHLILISTNRILYKKSPDKNYSKIRLSANDIEEDVKVELTKEKISVDHIGVNFMALIEEDYLRLWPNENGEPNDLEILPKGFTAMTSGEFYIKYESRKRDLDQIENAKTANRINFWIMIFAAGTLILGLMTLLKECNAKNELQYRQLETQSPKPSPVPIYIDTCLEKKAHSIPFVNDSVKK